MSAAGWLEPAPIEGSVLERALGWNPELLQRFKFFHDSFWDEALLPADLLEMLRIRIAQIHGCSAELAIRHETDLLSEAKRASLSGWRKSRLFSQREQILLDYAERIPFEHHFIADGEAAAVRRELGDAGYVAFTVAVSLFDALCRLRMALGMIDEASGENCVPSPGITRIH